MDYVARLASPVGELTLASDGEVLTGLWIAGQKYHSSGLGLESREARLPVFEAAADWLERYFPGNARSPTSFRWRRAAAISAGASGACCWRYQAAKSGATAK